MTDTPDQYVESAGMKYRVCRLKHFIQFRDFAMAKDKAWSEAFNDKKGMMVESRPEEVAPGQKPTGINIVRVNFDIPTVDPEQLYDSLHDPDYRKSWDTNMLSGYNIAQFDPRNDIGYYAAETPSRFVTKRDFCNMRSWMEFTNGDFIIMNRSEPHADCPEQKNFIRGNSIRTGYYCRPMDGGGTKLVYVSHSDIKGSIPAMIMNTVMTKMAPKVMRNLESCAQKYPEWADANYEPGFQGPWRTSKIDWDGSLGDGSPEVKKEPPPQIPGDKSADTSSKDAPPAATGAPGESKDEPAVAGGGTSSTAGGDAALKEQLDELKRQLFVANQRGDRSSTLAPVAPARPDDSVAVQQYRALMNDAVNFIDRQYLQEGRVPTSREYLTRLHCVVDGMQRTIHAAQ